MLFTNRDNYGFVTFRHADEAFTAIESKLKCSAEVKIFIISHLALSIVNNQFYLSFTVVVFLKICCGLIVGALDFH